MVEGSFPKSDGEVLFSSEANKFNPKFYGQVEQFAVGASGTGFQTLGGTITYSGTESSLTMSSFITAQCSVGKRSTDSTDNPTLRYRLSGAGMNIVTETKGTTQFNWATSMFHTYTSGAITASGGNIGSDYILSVEQSSSSLNSSAHVGDLLLWGF